MEKQLHQILPILPRNNCQNNCIAWPAFAIYGRRTVWTDAIFAIVTETPTTVTSNNDDEERMKLSFLECAEYQTTDHLDGCGKNYGSSKTALFLLLPSQGSGCGIGTRRWFETNTLYSEYEFKADLWFCWIIISSIDRTCYEYSGVNIWCHAD